MKSIAELKIKDILNKLEIGEFNAGASSGSDWLDSKAENIKSFSPVDGMEIADIQLCDDSRYDEIIKTAQEAFLVWRKKPAPLRGEIVRQIGDELRQNKHELGMLVTYEMGKSYQGEI